MCVRVCASLALDFTRRDPGGRKYQRGRKARVKCPGWVDQAQGVQGGRVARVVRVARVSQGGAIRGAHGEILYVIRAKSMQAHTAC